jgi:pyruvate kinase
MISIHSRTKIVSTLGPAIASKEKLQKMIEAGVNVFRLNFSHSKLDEHKRFIDTIRELNKEMGTNVALLADLQGPKLRVGEIENNHLDLNDGDIITFTTEKCIGTKEHIYMSYQTFPRDVNVGEFILIDDGKLKLEVLSTDGQREVKAKVIHGGPLSSKKGVNLPNTKISLPSLTEEDKVNAAFALDQGVDWIALSFVRTASDIVDLKEIIRHKKGHAGVIAKIEKPEALLDIDNIIDLTDGVMVARGDMGVEVPFQEVPIIQKTIVAKCIERSKPVIIATQMMESMITNFRPTRAEATDVANAVLDGADALMLSGETSVGNYPVETIEAMHSIIKWTESHGYSYMREHEPEHEIPKFLPDSICFNACRMASQSKASSVVAFTHSGFTALHLASHRPEANIFAFTDNPLLTAKLSLVWGTEAYTMQMGTEIDNAITQTIEELKVKGKIKHNDVVIHVGSTPLGQQGRVNMIKISLI